MNNKKSVVTYYAIETRDFRPKTSKESYWDWDEIGRKDTLDEANAEYEKQLAMYDTLRLVKVIHTTIVRTCKAPRFTGGLDQLSIEDQHTLVKLVAEKH